MKILLKNARIHASGSTYNRSRKNILIQDGIIKDISDKNSRADKIIDCSGMGVSVGWFDMWTRFGDPGFEQKEDMTTGLASAVAGGFSGVALLPNNHPVTDSKNAVRYLHSKAKGSPVEVYPIGAVTVGAEGRDLSEMIDLHEAGAVAFSDGINSIQSTDILLKGLQYLQKFDGLLINRPVDRDLSMFAQMHEGKMSTVLGMRGVPRIAEDIIIERDLRLLEYAGGKIHFGLISTEGAVKLIRNAKKKYNVSCSVAAHQLLFEDKSIENFDTNFKVDPPFRTQSDIRAMKKGLLDGTIDVIVSAHDPQDTECKNLEFDLAEFGAIGLQTVFSSLVSLSGDIKLDLLLEKITVNPRRLLGINIPSIEVGEPANLTLFDTGKEWIFDESSNKSRSLNSPFLGMKLKGKAQGVFNRNNFWIDPELD
jgi:dihydroorotase